MLDHLDVALADHAHVPTCYRGPALPIPSPLLPNANNTLNPNTLPHTSSNTSPGLHGSFLPLAVPALAHGSRLYYRRQLLARSLQGRRVELLTVTDCNGASEGYEERVEGALEGEAPAGPPAVAFHGKKVHSSQSNFAFTLCEKQYRIARWDLKRRDANCLGAGLCSARSTALPKSCNTRLDAVRQHKECASLVGSRPLHLAMQNVCIEMSSYIVCIVVIMHL